MTDIYTQHDKAFANVAAYVVTDKDGRLIATIAFKYPKDGAGRLWCYFHILGFPMVRGSANGFGYDKHSAAAHAALRKVQWQGGPTAEEQRRYDYTKAMIEAVKDEGSTWDRDLRDAGFNVLQAV